MSALRMRARSRPPGWGRLQRVDADELAIVVAAPVGASALERDGMLRRLEGAVTDAIADIATHGYIVHGTADATEARLTIDAPHLASPDVLALIGDAVTTLMTDPDLLGWGPFSLNVTDETPDPDRPLDLDTDVSGFPTIERVDPEPARRRLRDNARHLAHGLDPAWLTDLDLHADDPDQRARAHAQAQYVAGALYQAAVVTIDYLFDDLATLRNAGENATVATAEHAAFITLEELPDRYAHRYDALFTRQLIVATVDVTRRFTDDWEPLACVAQELALVLLLNEAEQQLELADLDLGDWRDTVEDHLFEDNDHEILFNPSLDGAEDDKAFLAQTGAAPMAFPDWFTPFNPERHLPPYLLDQPRRT